MKDLREEDCKMYKDVGREKKLKLKSTTGFTGIWHVNLWQTYRFKVKLFHLPAHGELYLLLLTGFI